jgi:hypothetical protein
MEWLNLHASVLDSPEVVGAEPTDRATWLFLLRYCAGQENGGVIAGCASWGDRKWQQLVRVTLVEVKRDSMLWRMVGQDLEVNFYPVDKQKEIEAKREAGRSTVAKRWDKQSCSANSSAISSATRSADTEGKGREGKGKEVGQKPIRAAVAAPTCDSEWLANLSSNPAYTGINVSAEFGRMQAWCAVNKKQATRRRFVNWLNRCERPMSAYTPHKPFKIDLPEPRGWQTWLAKQYPGNLVTQEGRPWASLDKVIQAEARNALGNFEQGIQKVS